MSKNLDLSGFKKISEDKQSATLQHKDGHTLKIAKKALSSKMRDMLSKLPMVQGYADGGEVKEEIDDVLLRDKGGFSNLPPIDVAQMYAAPLPISATSTRDNTQGIPADRSALKATSEELQTLADKLKAEQGSGRGASGTWGEPEPVPEPAPVAQEPTKVAVPLVEKPMKMMDIQEPMSTITIPQPPPFNPIKTPEETRLQMSSEDEAWQKDLANQHITPQTYSGLFAKKDTLGKIGTIFGLMVSGAGAGLTHQPNALLALMQKEIDNDLEAQKQSKANAQNFLRLNQEHQKRLAEITHLGQQGELLQAQTAAVPSQVKLNQAQAHSLNTQTQITSDTLAHTQALRAAYHDLQSRVDKMPEGSPQRVAAQQQLAMILPMVNEAITNKIDQASALQGYVQSIYGNMHGGAGGERSKAAAVDYGRMNQLQRMGINKIPGGMTGEDIGAATKEAQLLEESRALRADYTDSFAKLSEMALGGHLHPAQRAAYVNSLGAKLARQSAGRYNLAEAGTIVDGMFPALGDAPETTAVKFKKGNDYFDNVDAATPTLNRYNLKIPVQAPKVETMQKYGATYQKVNGGWQKVKK